MFFERAQVHGPAPGLVNGVVNGAVSAPREPGRVARRSRAGRFRSRPRRRGGAGPADRRDDRRVGAGALRRSPADRHALAVPDNCEHVMEESAVVASALLSACPNLRLPATSREVLGVPGELVAAVSPADGEAEAIAALCRMLDRLRLAAGSGADRCHVADGDLCPASTMGGWRSAVPATGASAPPYGSGDDRFHGSIGRKSHKWARGVARQTRARRPHPVRTRCGFHPAPRS